MLRMTDGERDFLAELNRDATEDTVWEFERERWDWLESLANRLVASIQADGIADPPCSRSPVPMSRPRLPSGSADAGHTTT